MAQYYNLVTGTSVPIMVEDVQQICDGQSIQLVVEDINNCTNGGQQYLTYTTGLAHNEGSFIPQRAIVGGQLTGVPIDQRQNVYIINTRNDLQQSSLKADVVHANVSTEGIVNIVDERGTKLPLNNIHEPQQQHQQIQWISMPENNINYEGTVKPTTAAVKLAPAVRNPQQRIAPAPQVQEQFSGTPVAQYVGPGPSEKKAAPRLYRNKGRGCVTGGGPPRQSLPGVDSNPVVKGIVGQQRSKSLTKPQLAQSTGGVQGSSTDSPGVERANSNLTNNRTSGVNNSSSASIRGKGFGSTGAPVQNMNSRGTTPVRSGIMSRNPDNPKNSLNSPAQVMKNLSAAHYPAMDSLSERIKQAKLQKVMPTPGLQALNVPNSPTVPTPTARPPLHGVPTRSVHQTTPISQRPMATTNPATLNQRANTQTPGEKSSLGCTRHRLGASPNLNQQQPQQQQQQQQRRATTKTPQQSLLQDSRHKIEIVKKQTPSSPQKYQRETAQSTNTSSASGNASESDEKMEIDSITSECTVDSDNPNNHEQEQPNDDNDGSSSFAFLQKVIDSPHETIVQSQIAGNTVKMLVVLQNGEQRLITFDIPNEPCTVQDLLEQANISFGEMTCVSLVSDRILGINYIVEGGAHMAPNCQDSNDSGEGETLQENSVASPDSTSPNFAIADENSNSSVTPNEEPKFVDGKLAVCPNCGISSPDFHRCSRCKRILPDNVKSIPMTPDTQANKKETMMSIDNFYKKAHEQHASLKREASSSKVESSRGKKPAARGGRRPVAKTRPVKEPECLTISSDEEDGDEKARKCDSNMSSVSTLSGCGTNAIDDMDTILEKEPVITNSSSSTSTDCTVDSEGGVKGGGREDDSMEDGSGQKPQTSLICRTVRIGSYKYVPREGITISQSGVRLAVPLLEDENSFVNLEIKYKEIVKVLIHFGKMMPVLFFYTSTSSAAAIREVLGMQDPKGPYYDPAGRDNTHKRITLLPEILEPEAKIILKGLFMPDDLLVELTPKEANDILVRCSPKDATNPALGNLIKKPNQLTNSTTPGVNGSGAQQYQIMTVYPPPPSKGGIAINTEDYVCLGEDQFLNDAIIDFYLRYLTLEVLSEADHNRTHVFSSYFYKRLTSPHAQVGESSPALTPAARRHARVQKWTKNVNIFEKDFVIIPINEHAHWFLAIICYPGLVGKVIAAPQPPKEKSAQKIQKNKKSKEMKVQAVTIGNTTITPVTTTITIDQMDEGSERDEAEGDDEEMEMDSDEDEETENQDENTAKPPQNLPTPTSAELYQKATVKIPCILIFDSLAGASRSRVVATLRDYLSCEHVAKVGTEKVFSKDTIKGSSPKVPQQSNFTDCGLYLLQYVESFFQDPIKNYTLPIKTLKTWFEEIVVTRKREELAKLLVRLMNQTKGDKTITLPVVQFPTHDGKLRPKPETPPESKTPKSEIEAKKKSTQSISNPSQSQSISADDKTRIVALSTSSVLTTTESIGEKSEIITKTTTVYQIMSPQSSSSSVSSGDSSQESLFDSKPKTPSGTLSYLRNKRIPRLMTREQEGQENQPTSAKKYKSENESGLKSTSSVGQAVTASKAVIATNNDSCK
ncbi:uncharacterized protein [Venturia canescens]|uniref:uncharacterized protein isoform X2 n=1 Tax=Venturia canescens TaxID=32260 RepID=UPI001C9CEBE7|nr:uncharacterized protein LOC122414273 isoform X2 [Venturia canescens]